METCPISPPELTLARMQDLVSPISQYIQTRTAIDDFRNPIDEHARILSADVQEGIQLNQVMRSLLPKWGDTIGARTIFGKYTANASVLQHMQTHQTQSNNLSQYSVDAPACAEYRNEVCLLFKDTTFFSKYNYMDWKIAEPFNTSAEFMGTNVISQYATPIMHTFFPLYVIFMPLVALFFDQICGKDSCSELGFWNVYICGIYQKLNRHFIGKQIFRLNASPFITGMLLCAWAVYYVVQGYAHYTHIIHFTQHLSKAAQFVQRTRFFLNTAIEEWTSGWEHSPLTHASPEFQTYMSNRVAEWKHMQTRLQVVPETTEITLSNIRQIGPALVQLYRLYTSETDFQSLLVLPSWLEYAGAIREWSTHIHAHQLTFATIHPPGEIGENVKPHMDGHTHPILNSNTAIRNSADLDSHYILTGVNASGKSTCMKSVLLNLIMTQSLGAGRYTDCVLIPYTHFHLYLNIPDTMEKDSLFQAEVRRCRDILNILQNDNDSSAHHFCAFDELFTGTNPHDAERVTFAYMRYIATTYSHVQCWLTTHFHTVCSRLRQDQDVDHIKYGYMKGTPPNYTYQMHEGISTDENASIILKQFEFPENIISWL